MKKKIKIRNSGFSLLEIALSIAISIIMVGTALYFYNIGSVVEKTNEAEFEIKTIQDAVHNLGSGQQNWSWLGPYGAPTIAQSGMIPAKYVQGMGRNNDFSQATGILSPFGTTVYVAQGSTHFGSNFNSITYYITLFDLPQMACETLANNNFQNKIADVVINGSYYRSGALSGSQISNLCNSSHNSVGWDFL